MYKFCKQVLTRSFTVYTNAIGQEPVAAAPTRVAEEQPYENTLRQDSYITDTDRSFPLAGGVVSNPHETPAHESHGREGLAGAAAAATAMGVSHAIPRSEERDTQELGRETRQATYGDIPPATVPDSTVCVLLSHQLTTFSVLGIDKPNMHADSNGH